MVNKIVVNQEQSASFKLNKEDVKKLAKSLALTVGGVVIAFLADTIPTIDYGIYSELVYAISPFILNVLRKLIAGKK